MKRIVAAIAVLFVVGGLFAFAPKDQNFCFYKKVSPSSCPLNARPESFEIVSNLGGDEYIQNEDAQGNCPSAVFPSLCNKQIDIIMNNPF